MSDDLVPRRAPIKWQWHDAVLASTDPGITTATIAVSGALVSDMNADGCCWPSTRRLQDRARCGSRHTVLSAIRRLETAELLDVDRRHKAVSTYRARLPSGALTAPDTAPDGKPIQRNLARSTPQSGALSAQGTPEPSNPLTIRVSRLCEQLADSIADRGSKRPTITKAWLTDMDRLLRLDGHSEDDVAKVIRWLTNGTDEIARFWAPNVRSPAKLRARWDQMREQHAARGNGAGRRTQRNRDAADTVIDAVTRRQPALPERSAS